MANTNTSVLAPSGSVDRLLHIDILRGFTLLGVLLANIQYLFRAPMGHQNLSYSLWPGLGNDVATWIIRALFDMKSVFLLSILFGVGLAIQMERTEDRGAQFGAFATRRLLVLVGFGLIHIGLVWNGDILHAYGLLGLLSLLFVHRKAKTLWRWVIGIWVLITLLTIAGPIKTLLGSQPEWMTPAAIRPNDVSEIKFISYLSRHYQSSSWLQVAKFRISDFVRIFAQALPAWIVLFGNILFGLAIWKSGLLKKPEEHLPALKRFVCWALPVGILLHIIHGFKFTIRFWGYERPWNIGRFVPLVTEFASIVGAIVFCLGIGAGFLVLTQNNRWKRRLIPLAALGRMTLTTYLIQSLVMTTVFYGWGLGFYNRMSPMSGLILGLVFFVLQVGVSVWWLRRFRFGPAEWLWRCLSYAKIQPFKLDRAVTISPTASHIS